CEPPHAVVARARVPIIILWAALLIAAPAADHRDLSTTATDQCTVGAIARPGHRMRAATSKRSSKEIASSRQKRRGAWVALRSLAAAVCLLPADERRACRCHKANLADGDAAARIDPSRAGMAVIFNNSVTIAAAPRP